MHRILTANKILALLNDRLPLLCTPNVNYRMILNHPSLPRVENLRITALEGSFPQM